LGSLGPFRKVPANPHPPSHTPHIPLRPRPSRNPLVFSAFAVRRETSSISAGYDCIYAKGIS
jgi:hypothetical protein